MTENDLRDQLIRQGELCKTRSFAYSLAREYRSHGLFARVILISNLYFVITNEDDYNDLWEIRKACRAYERSLKKS